MNPERTGSHPTTRSLAHRLIPGCVSVVLTAGLWLTTPAAQAQTPESVSLNLSNQNFTATGIGPYEGDLGKWDLAQGACVTGATSTSCTLTGTINTSSIGGLAGGTYTFLTSYANGGGVPVGISSSPTPPNNEYFNYLSLPITTSMVLTLTPTSGTPLVETLVSGGFGESGVSLQFLYGGTPVCSDTSISCDPYTVGLTNAGNTYSAPVTTTVDFNVPTVVPLPASSGLLGSGLLLLIALRRLRPRGTRAGLFAY
jgi:hypothetical protein